MIDYRNEAGEEIRGDWAEGEEKLKTKERVVDGKKRVRRQTKGVIREKE